MHQIVPILASVIIVGALVPIAFTVMFRSENDTCFPVPSLLIPAYSDSLYFNTTNHRWYTVTTSYVESMVYDGYADGVSFNQDQVFNGNPAKGNISYVENLDSNYNGMNFTTITLVAKARISNDNGTLTNDTIRMGIFDSTTGALIEQFGNDTNPNDLLIRDNVIHLYNFTGSYVITNGSAVTVGMYVVYDNSGFVDNSDTWFNYNSYYYTSTNPSAKGSGIPAPFLDMNYREYENGVFGLDDPTSDFATVVYKSTSTNTYTIIPLTGDSPNQTTTGIQQCADTWSIMAIVAIIFMVILILIFLTVARSDRD